MSSGNRNEMAVIIRMSRFEDPLGAPRRIAGAGMRIQQARRRP
jgi:hypothetical protein